MKSNEVLANVAGLTIAEDAVLARSATPPSNVEGRIGTWKNSSMIPRDKLKTFM